ncbi:MAG: transcription elongation factor GreA [Candidatus Dadabacteria bacterium]|nr:MAG: transcription elongation factor GreA [Candidatus Dadabacteria bacterium]
MDKVPMTPRGYEELRKELKRLKGLRPEISREIERAREHGDLSENADYDAAKERSGMIEAKIRDIEAKLSRAQVIDPASISDTNRVVFGVTVTVLDLDTEEKRKLTIVGTDEADISSGLISFDSPLAKSIMGKEVGDVVVVSLPNGKKEYEIIDITVTS